MALLMVAGQIVVIGMIVRMITSWKPKGFFEILAMALVSGCMLLPFSVFFLLAVGA